MKLSTAWRILSQLLFKRGVRENYYALCRTISRVASLFKSSNRVFARQVAKDCAHFLLNKVTPAEGQIRERARAAVDWILVAQQATADGGVSLGYFPCDGGSGWRASYPESTGYIIPSLLEFARWYGDDSVSQRAIDMAHWEVEIQMESGAVQGGPVCPPDQQRPAVFNTGMVLDGWSAAYRATGETRFLAAGQRAADFLVGDLDPDGYLRTHGGFVTHHPVKTYCSLCAWPLYQHGQNVRAEPYQRVAVRIVEAALRQQRPNGWFAYNDLSHPESPLLHTIGYTLQGILEVGILAGREDFIEAVRRGTDPLVSRLSPKGFLYGRYYDDWEPASMSSCLTGSAQLSVVLYRLYEHTGRHDYLSAADLILNFLKPLQVMDSPNRFINGAIPGSFPLLGGYMTAGYPNWATKFYLDALMLQDRLGKARVYSASREREKQELCRAKTTAVPQAHTERLVYREGLNQPPADPAAQKE